MRIERMVTDFLEDKQAGVRRGDLSPKTVREYRQPLEHVLLPFCQREGIGDAVELDAKALDRLKDHLMTNGARSGKALSRATVNSYLRAVNVFLNWARKREDGIGATVRLLKIAHEDVEALSRDEIQRIENAAGHERDKLIVRILADTGIRVGELIGLRVTDVVPQEGKFFLRVHGKTGQHDVPLLPELHKRLRRYINETRPKKSESDRLFLGLRRRPGGGVEPLTESGVQQIVRELAETAEIGRRVHPHLFRHAYFTLQSSRGVPLLLLKKIGGWKSLAMLDRVYSHPTPIDAYDAIQRSMQGMGRGDA